jgi:hypothetical protein
MKRILLLFTLLLATIHIWAFDFEKDGIYYDKFYAPNQLGVTSGTNKYSGSVIIPASVVYNNVTYSVTYISGSTFSNCPELISVTIPNTVTSIGEWAFGGSIALTSVSLPNSITSISQYTFSGCKGLESLIIPNSVTNIGKYAFYACTNLISVSIPNSVTNIDHWAFSGCSSLATIAIPNSVVTIGMEAFENCYRLTSVKIPASVTDIGWYTFSFCTALTSINVDVKNKNYKSYKGVLFNKDMTSLIKLPEGFSGSYKMPNTVLEMSDLSIASCKNLTSITFSNKLNRIRDAVFIHCTGLTSINLPSSITSIGYSAFNGCVNLISINIPNSVTYLGNTTFQDCINLKSIHARSVVPVQLDNQRYNTFIGVPLDSCILYVPKGSKTVYENTPQWWDFSTIVEEETFVDEGNSTDDETIVDDEDIVDEGNITCLQTVTATKLDISVIGDKVQISNLKVGELVQVYTSNGEMVLSEKATNATSEIQLSKNKMYIIKSGSKYAKIIL